MDLFTVNIDSPLQIRKADNIYRLTIKANGGTVFIRGNLTQWTFIEGNRTLASTDNTLFDGQSAVYQAAVMKGAEVLITPGTGTADVEIIFGAN